MLRPLRSSSSFLVSVVALAFFTDMFAYGVIVPVMPTALIERMHVPVGHEQYWISVLLATESAAALTTSPLAGYLVDLCKSRQIAFLTANALLAGSILCIAFATSVPLLIVGRCFKGAATAVVMVSGFAMVLDVAGLDKIGITLGWLSCAKTAGFAIGPVVGGVLYKFGGWWSVFGTTLGMIFLDVLLRCAVIEHGEPNEIERSDSEVAVQRELEGPPAHTSRLKEGKVFAFVVLLRQPRMMCMLCGVVVSGLLVSSFDAILPIFVQDQFGWGSLGQGLIFLPTAVPSILDPLYGYLVVKFGVRVAAVLAFLLLGPTLVCLRLISQSDLSHQSVLVGLLTVFGMLVDVADVALIVETDDIVRCINENKTDSSEQENAIAQSFGLQSMAYNTGLLIGPLWAGMIQYHGEWKLATLTLGILSTVTVFPMLKVGRRSMMNQDSEE